MSSFGWLFSSVIFVLLFVLLNQVEPHYVVIEVLSLLFGVAAILSMFIFATNVFGRR